MDLVGSRDNQEQQQQQQQQSYSNKTTTIDLLLVSVIPYTGVGNSSK
jgi:hypothetical protein